ncbi:hypothetical protein KBC75_03550 [Candidatus Shapirobacteria bacterium]|nr:hypothetical protein [Candidatus Shapirobacteria bacterium]
MNWLSKILIIFSFLKLNPPSLDPSSPKNNNYQQYQESLIHANLDINNLQYYDYRHELEFNLKTDNGSTTRVIFDTSQDPLIQVSALQKIIKVANIKGKEIRLVDLSSPHPYATLKNN